jgi:hypothetical protein
VSPRLNVTAGKIIPLLIEKAAKVWAASDLNLQAKPNFSALK